MLRSRPRDGLLSVVAVAEVTALATEAPKATLRRSMKSTEGIVCVICLLEVRFANRDVEELLCLCVLAVISDLFVPLKLPNFEEKNCRIFLFSMFRVASSSMASL